MPPSPIKSEKELVARAVSGDRVALEDLLLAHGAQLLRLVESKMPMAIRDSVGAEDVVQTTFSEVIRCVRSFDPERDPSFSVWLTTIAERRLLDMVRRQTRIKRGGGRRRVRKPAVNQQSSYDDLLNLLSGGRETPSGSVTRHEAIQAVKDAVASLRADYRQAIELRCLEGKTLVEAAHTMNRTPRAVQGLVDRAKKKLRATLASLSRYE